MFPATKFTPPISPTAAFQRTRLFDLINQGWQQPVRLILLSAPPGYGKTTVLTGWVARSNVPSAWVALDGEDNEPNRFFLLLAQALQPHYPPLQALQTLLSLPQNINLLSLSNEIINNAAQSKQRLLLVLDDYHLIQNPAVHTLIQHFIEYLPPQLTLAVLSREDPPLPLARLRVRQQILELRSRDLVFTPEEAAGFLVQGLSLPLNPSQVGELNTLTEGWAAALQLAALHLRDHPQPDAFISSLRQSNRYVLDYLVGEVLERLPADLYTFLCQTALLQRFTAELCDFALQRSDSRTMLTRLEKANLFLMPLDSLDQWYRYHHLIADILKVETPAQEQAAIFQRAAAWLRDHEQPTEAVRYALACRDYDLAARLIRRVIFTVFENGLLQTALNWLEALPEEFLLSQPDLSVFRCWLMIMGGQFNQAGIWIDRIYASGEVLPNPVAGLLHAFQEWMRIGIGQNLDAHQLEEAYQMTGDIYPYFSPFLNLAIGQAYREASQLDRALQSFERGERMAEDIRQTVTSLIIRNNRAFLLNEMGERKTAHKLCRDTITALQETPGMGDLFAGIPQLPLGIFTYENGEIEEGIAILRQGIHRVTRLGLYDILTAPANYTLMNALAFQGKLDEALRLNREVRRRAAQNGLPVVARECELIAAWLQFLAGDAAPAARWVSDNPLPADYLTNPRLHYAAMLHARMSGANGQTNAALEVLLPLLDYSHANGLQITRIRTGIEIAVILAGSGQVDRAMQILKPLLERMESTGYIQAARRQREFLLPLQRWIASLYPALAHRLFETAKPAPPIFDSLVETPTEREIQILRLVAAGMSNADISANLYLTVGTVKWYLTQIFGKLGVNRRTEAVAKARQIGLI